MGRRGEHNIGQLCRQHFGEEAVLIGFGTDRGTVMAASRWGTHPEVQQVRPSLDGSHGAVFRQAGQDRFLLDLRRGAHDSLRQALKPERLERAIGVLYVPATERVSHYFEASLPDQFDAYLWFEKTRAVTPIRDGDLSLPADHPFAP
jgi:erythromycin esterase-like protein